MVARDGERERGDVQHAARAGGEGRPDGGAPQRAVRFFRRRGELLDEFADLWTGDGADETVAPCTAAHARLGNWTNLCAALAHHYRLRLTVLARWPLWEGLTHYRELLREHPPEDARG